MQVASTQDYAAQVQYAQSSYSSKSVSGSVQTAGGPASVQASSFSYSAESFSYASSFKGAGAQNVVQALASDKSGGAEKPKAGEKPDRPDRTDRPDRQERLERRAERAFERAERAQERADRLAERADRFAERAGISFEDDSAEAPAPAPVTTLKPAPSDGYSGSVSVGSVNVTQSFVGFQASTNDQGGISVSAFAFFSSTEVNFASAEFAAGAFGEALEAIAPAEDEEAETKAVVAPSVTVPELDNLTGAQTALQLLEDANGSDDG